MTATPGRGLTAQAAHYTHDLTFDRLSDEVVDRTKQLFLDFLGVALGGRAFSSYTAAFLDGVSALAAPGSGSATVVGESAGYPAHYAALLNAAFAHSMDFDDTHRAAIMHVGTPVFAALMAVAEGRATSGREFLLAAAGGYEVSCKLGVGHLDLVHLRGFHPTATTGVFGATAAASRLMGLSPDVVESALGLDLSFSSGNQQFADGGGANKSLQVGLAAHNAIVSLTLAAAGLAGTRQPLEGRLGYYATYAEPGSDLARADFASPAPSEVMQMGIKPYPCCRYSHGTIDGVSGLVAQHGLRPDDIQAISVEVPPAGFRLVGADPDLKRRPASTVDAQFSNYFAAAVAAAGRQYTWDSYGELGDPVLERLMDRVSVRQADDLVDMQTRLTLTSSKGAWSLQVPYPKGEPELPLTWDELEAKFMALGRRVIDEARLAELVDLVRRLEDLPSITLLTGLLRTDGRE